MTTLTVLVPGDRVDADGGGTVEVEAEVEGPAVLVDPASLPAVLGWSLREEGLCRGDVCVPLAADAGVRRGDRVDLVATATALGCPTLLDPDGGPLAVGVARQERRRALEGREAPPFTLPDLDGTPHSLDDHQGRKRLLVAFASW
jgi:hypothetical protein